MITRVGMAPRRRGMTTQQFLDHWRTAHADAAGRIPNVRRYVQLHPVLSDGRLPLPWPLFDACSMLDFDDLVAMDEGFASDVYQGQVRDDEDRFVDKDRFSMVVTQKETLEPLPRTGVVLVSFLHRHPAVTPDQFRAIVTGPWRSSPGGRGREQALAIDAGRSGREVNVADAVDLRGFSAADEAVDWLRDENGGVSAMMELAGYVHGVSHVIARAFRVL